MYEKYLNINPNIDKSIVDFVENNSKIVLDNISELENIKEINQLKVLDAFKKEKLSNTDFNWTTGYGYGDVGREKLERIFSHIFKAKDAIVRQEITCGTHAIALALYGNLLPNDELIYVTGRPYDTLLKVIGIVGNEHGTILDYGIKYKEIDLVENKIDVENVIKNITEKTKMLAIQRSAGYGNRNCLSINELERAIKEIKKVFPNIIVMVDNCYCEFVEEREPIEVGADIVVGSLLKNLGAGITLNGGYVVSNSSELIKNIANRLTTPGLAKEVGVSFGTTRTILQGLFFSPHIVMEAVKSAMLFSLCFEKLGYKTIPNFSYKRSDIIQTITFNDENKVVEFCRGLQSACCVDSHIVPYPWEMPGYSDKIVMASGSFIDGSTIELSADAPLREPYNVYFQGGLSYYQTKFALVTVLDKFIKNDFIKKLP